MSGPGGGFAGQYTAWVRCSSPSRQAMPDLEDRFFGDVTFSQDLERIVR